MDATVQKVAPSIVGACYGLSHMPLADIAAGLTILYTFCLLVDWGIKKFKEYSLWRRQP